MRKRFWIVNLVLLASVVGLGWKLRADWRAYAARNGPRSLVLHPLHGVSEPAAPSLRDYSAVTRQNPFSADRNDAVPQAEQAKPVGPPPLVYGSVILGASRFALLGTEESPKPQRVSEGNTFGGYRLVRVLPQSVVLESSGAQTEIMLYNALARLRREHARTAAASSSAAPPPVQTVGGGAPPTPVATSAPSNPTQPALPLPTPPGQPRPGMRVMQTPWGPIWVEDRRPPQ